jgi:hypothetical protein
MQWKEMYVATAAFEFSADISVVHTLVQEGFIVTQHGARQLLRVSTYIKLRFVY